MAAEGLLSLKDELLGAGPPMPRIGRALVRAREFLSSVRPVDIIDDLLSGAKRETRGTVTGFVSCVDHVGFVVPAETDVSALSGVATESGFPTSHQNFRSAIVARELSALAGNIPVPTQIFRCSTAGSDQPGKTFGAEIFVPSADSATVKSWIARGIGTHIALRVRERALVDQAKTLLVEEGFRLPGFMRNEPMENQSDGTRTVYFDLEQPGGVIRLEFFHRH